MLYCHGCPGQPDSSFAVVASHFVVVLGIGDYWNFLSQDKWKYHNMHREGLVPPVQSESPVKLDLQIFPKRLGLSFTNE
jgi:hypothetical protein